jgi:hypothetical protein
MSKRVWVTHLGEAPSVTFEAVPTDSTAWGCVDEVRSADWNMPPTAAEISEVMRFARTSPTSKTNEDRLGNIEKQMSLMMRMMLKLMQQSTSSSSSSSLRSSSSSSIRGRSGSPHLPAVFQCPVCDTPPMTEKSFYKHIKSLMDRDSNQRCRMPVGHPLLQSFEGSHEQQLQAFVNSVRRKIRPGSNVAHTEGGTGNHLLLSGYFTELLKAQPQ